MHGKVLEVGQVEPVEPDHGARAVLAVVVPVPGRREDHVAALHADAPAVHGGEAALALDDEAHGEGDVPVGAGRLVGHDELEACVEGVGREGGIFLVGAHKSGCCGLPLRDVMPLGQHSC